MNRRLLVAILAGLIMNDAFAQDFAIENEILVDGEVIQKGWTIFSEQNIVDAQLPDKFVGNPNVTVFSANKKEFRILSPRSRKQSVIAVSRLRRMAAEMTVLAKDEQPFIQFAANPRFNVSYSQRSEKLVMRSNIWTYTATKNKHAQAENLADRYRSFADAFANFNILSSPVPPNARLELNRRMAENRIFPGTVSLSIRNGDRTIERMSRHTIHMKLTDDHQRIVSEANTGMKTYNIVSIDKFWTDLVAKRPEAEKR